MFPRKNRLSSQDIASFWSRKDAKIRRTPLFSVYCAINTLRYNRCTVVVSGKIDRRAVKRNAIRRRLRGMLTPELERGKKGYDIVIVVSPKIREAKPKEIAALLHEAVAELITKN